MIEVPERQKIGRGGVAILVAAMAGLVTAILLAQVTVPYAVMTPGPAMNTLGEVREGSPLIVVDGAPTYPTEGELNFTTVRIGGGPGNETTIFDYISARFSDEATILPVEQVFPPGATRTEIREENQAEMAGSQQGAAAVALRELGFEVEETVTVVGIDEASTFVGSLKEGDIITGVNGTPTDSSEAVRAEVAKVPIDGEVSIQIERNGRPMSVEGRTIDAGGRPVLGIYLSRSFDSEVEVTISAGDVGGSSAGMMFALAIYDVLTEGPLTGGKDIAGTGTINPEGQVGPISGIKQKVIGAKKAGSEYFLAPESNCAELKGEVPDGIEVFSVSTFDEALAAVEAIAADDVGELARCG
ncbi:MAG: PDZ domain-containing protein [Actinomycetales bacterium]|nr:PDZ domain-containing protein [Actinomycetales bacterium]